MAHLCHLNACLEMTSGLIQRSRALIATAKPPEVLKEVRVADNYEAKLLVTHRIMEILSTAGYSCELRHGVDLH
jgi:hypothetical protein